MKVALIQITVGSNFDENFEKSKKFLQDSLNSSPDFILLPECFLFLSSKSKILIEMNHDSVKYFKNFSVNKKIIVGPNKLTGEWGQNPIPGPMDEYEKSVKRHCGRVGAVEVFLSGPGLENYYEHITKTKISSRDIVSLYRENDLVAGEVMDVYFERIARSFSTFVNILDPDVIVCGGGMSEIDEIYDEVPNRIIPYIASNFFLTPIVKATHGSSSGVRGAAHLWN